MTKRIKCRRCKEYFVSVDGRRICEYCRLEDDSPNVCTPGVVDCYNYMSDSRVGYRLTAGFGLSGRGGE